MSSASSTEPGRARGESAFQPWHFYLILSMGGATWTVVVSRNTHPAALLLISAAAIGVGLVATAMHQALAGFLAKGEAASAPLTERRREFLRQEKAIVLRSIKELEFDRGMGKIGEQDFAQIGGRLRARALEIMQELDAPVARPASRRSPADAASTATPVVCGACRTGNDADARFCKHCGAELE